MDDFIGDIMRRISLIGFFFLSIMSTSTFAFNDGVLPQVQIGEPGTKAGDIISPVNRIEIAAWCDFNKQIVVVTPNIYLCSYNGKNGSS